MYINWFKNNISKLLIILSGLTINNDKFNYNIEIFSKLPFLDLFIKNVLNKCIPNLHGIIIIILEAYKLPTKNTRKHSLPKLVFIQYFKNYTNDLINKMLLFINRIIISSNSDDTQKYSDNYTHLCNIVEPIMIRGSSNLFIGCIPLLLTIMKGSYSFEKKILNIIFLRLYKYIEHCNESVLYLI